MSDAQTSPPFNHPDNVTIGKGRIIWAPSCGYGYPEVWCLLGGRGTTDIAEASAQAMWIDQVSRAVKK